jgi:hypothetical protein
VGWAIACCFIMGPGLLPGAAAAPPTKKAQPWWAYQPVTRPAPPAPASTGWVRSPIDAFILAKLESHGLKPSPPANRATLVRRLTYDLTGLPPAPGEVEAFIADDSPDALERLVDRLLASPRHGEKWGRHWLDLVRYAETNGYERDGRKPFVWRFRDYVIRAFNEDKPYDQFIREQLAGDELEPLTADGIIATGFLRLGLWDDEAADKEQAFFDEMDDLVATTGQAFLATTLNCARCHEHKVDPFPQEDYYRVLAFFRDIPRYGPDQNVLTDITDLVGETDAEGARESNVELTALLERQAELRRELEAIEAAGIVKLSAEEQRLTEGLEREKVLAAKLGQQLSPEQRRRRQELRGELRKLQRGAREHRLLALSVNNCAPTPPETHVLMRGSAHAPGEKVQPAFPQALASFEPHLPAPPAGARSAGRRRVLADWLASPENPLTARVLANRLWQHHFGRGIVRTPNDFGRLGDLPTHPELLDWLAAELVARDWSLKALHRTIVTSSAYRQSSADDPEGLARDPTNDLFWRFDLRRLTAEEIRDSILASSGSLNLAMGGPSIFTEVPAAVLQTSSQPGSAWGQSPPAERDRRSVYVHIKRSLIEPVLNAFDLADPDTSCAARFTTTVPTQALSSLNGDFFQREAKRFAARLRREAGGERAEQVRLALETLFSRVVAAREGERNVQWLSALEREEGLSPERALEAFCLVALNLNEFIYLD